MKIRAFTLIELIVVIAIIAILAAIIAPNAFRAIEKAKVAKVESDLKSFKTAALAYYADTGQWPPDGAVWETGEEIRFFITGEGQPAGWDGPYLERWSDPPWHGNDCAGGGAYDWDRFSGGFDPYDFGLGAYSGVAVSGPSHDNALKLDRDLDDGNLYTGRLKLIHRAEGGGTAERGYVVVAIIADGEGI